MTHVFRAVPSSDGRLDLSPDERARMVAALRNLAGKPVELEIRRAKHQRSLDQNAWTWGVAYPQLAEALGYEQSEIEDLHYGLVAKWGGEHFDKRMGQMVPNKRSSKLTTTEFSDYMEWLVRFAAQTAGVYIELPDEREVTK